MDQSNITGDAFFDSQQRRRQEQQARLTGRPILTEYLIAAPAPPPAVQHLVVRNGEDEGKVFELRPGVARIGREDGDEIYLDDKTVSRRQAVLRVDEGSVTVEGLRSTNPTKVNGRILQPEQPVPLVAGDRLEVGGVELAVKHPNEA